MLRAAPIPQTQPEMGSRLRLGWPWDPCLGHHTRRASSPADGGPSPLPEVVSAKEEEVREVVTAQPPQPARTMLEDSDGDDGGDDDGDDDSGADSNLVWVWGRGQTAPSGHIPRWGASRPWGEGQRGVPVPSSASPAPDPLHVSSPRQSPGSSRSGLAARHRRTRTKSPRMSPRCHQLQRR